MPKNALNNYDKNLIQEFKIIKQQKYNFEDYEDTLFKNCKF